MSDVWCSKCYGDHYTNDCKEVTPSKPVEGEPRIPTLPSHKATTLHEDERERLEIIAPPAPQPEPAATEKEEERTPVASEEKTAERTKCARCNHSYNDHYRFVGGHCNVRTSHISVCQCIGYEPSSPSQAEPQQGEVRKCGAIWSDSSSLIVCELSADHMGLHRAKGLAWKKDARPAQPQQPALSFEEWIKSEEVRYVIYKCLPQDAARIAWQASAQKSQKEMELPPWIKFPCPTCGAKAGYLCENEFGNASCMHRVLLSDKKQSPKIEWPEMVVSDEILAEWTRAELDPEPMTIARELQFYRRIRAEMEGR